jgi:RNA polymerase sigma-70 factor (ECF subfamily)
MPDEDRPGRAEFESEALTHFDALFATSRRLTRNGSEAEDLVQDTYVRALRAWRQFRAGTNLKAWLLTILWNLDRNRKRGHARTMVHADSERLAGVEDRLVDVGDSPEARLLRRTLDEDLRSALESLPKKLRDTVWLRDAQELSYAEIAAKLHIPIGTVMSRLSRGRQLLGERLSARQQEVSKEASL